MLTIFQLVNSLRQTSPIFMFICPLLLLLGQANPIFTFIRPLLLLLGQTSPIFAFTCPLAYFDNKKRHRFYTIGIETISDCLF